MPPAESDPQHFLPLTAPVFEILLSLWGEERHGYAILRAVEERTGGRMKMSPGTLYNALPRLLERRLIEEAPERPDPELDDERRRYYRLTSLGKSVARAEAQRLSGLVLAAAARGLVAPPAVPGSKGTKG